MEDDISKRIQSTKRECEEVKAQLENLIKSGIRNIFIDKQESVQAGSNEIEKIKNDSKNSEHTQQQKSSDNYKEDKIKGQNDTSPKKVKTYNVDETREYMKKQREKRTEQLKSTNNEKLKLEMRKNKLQELQKKSRELVERNIALKRARSKSREKTDYIRLDPVRSRSVSRERTKMDEIPISTRSRSQEKIRVNREDQRKTHSQKVTKIKKNPNLLYPPTPDSMKEKTNKNEADVKQNLQKNKIIILQNTTIRKGDNETGDTNDRNENKYAQVTVRKSPISKLGIDNKDVPSTTDKKNENEDEKVLNLKTDSAQCINKTVSLKKTTKETQTSEIKKAYPNWLDDQIGVSHPLNFINTVKRKLEFSTKPQAPGTANKIHNLVLHEGTDIQPLGIKSALPESPHTAKNYSEQSRLKYFLLHNYPNLNADKIENYELVPKKNNEKYVNSVTIRTNKLTETGSESDTSKNIPEISSESGTSLRKNAESVRRNLISDMDLHIDTNKIDNMKLITRNINTNTATVYSKDNSKTINNKKHDIITPHITINTDSRKTSSVNYMQDFDTESELEFDTPCLSKSRESIISFNSPESIVKSNILPNVAEQTETMHSSSFVPDAVSSLTSPLTSKKAEHSKPIPLSIIKRNKQENIATVSESSPVLNNEMCTKRDLNNTAITNTNERLNENVSSTGKLNSLQNSQCSKSFYPLYEKSATLTRSNVLSKSDSNISYINSKRGSDNRSMKDIVFTPLRPPTVSLINNIECAMKTGEKRNECLMKNISLRSKNTENMNNVNEIHLKFEAEIHLLNDFNESLRQFSALEKDFESLKHKNLLGVQLQNNYTQTSLPKTSSVSSIDSEIKGSDKNNSVSTINYSRGSLIAEDLVTNKSQSASSQIETSSLITGLSNLNVSCDSLSLNTDGSLSNFENLSNSNFVGVSVNMFEQLIKDEDARLENLKTILKIREKVLLDRTKGELAWLEIQRKYLKETGKLQEASLIKKKQRGILVNHQKETHEMRRLKQMQKAASTERKTILKKQRNFIRQQLSTKNMLTNIKVNTPRERRLSGPLKVIQSHTESIRSETSISKKNSSEGEREVYSITSQHSHSVVSRVSELSGSELSSKTNVSDYVSAEKQSAIKRTLLMRQKVLEKRRKAAEELLQWHKRLLEEEKRIIELESTATAIISQKPDKIANESKKYTFKGKQLNQLWYNLTGVWESRFVDDKTYPMSQIALERFCKSAREYSLKSKGITHKTSDSERSEARIDDVLSDATIPKEVKSNSVVEQLNGDISEHIVSPSEYASDFDVESINGSVSEDIEVVDQSIHQLIDKFGKIKDEIATLSLIRSRGNDNLKDNLNHANKFEKSDSEEEISVIETNKKINLEKEKLEDIVTNIISSKKDIEPLGEDDVNIYIGNGLDASQEKSVDILSNEDNLSTNSEENNKYKNFTCTIPSIEDKVKSATRDIVSKQLQVLDNLSEALVVTEIEKSSETEPSQLCTVNQDENKSSVESTSMPSKQVKITSDGTNKEVPEILPSEENQQSTAGANDQTNSITEFSNIVSELANIDSKVLEVAIEKQLSSYELPSDRNQAGLFIEKETTISSENALSEKGSSYSEIKSATEKSFEDILSDVKEYIEEFEENSDHTAPGPVEITSRNSCVSNQQFIPTLEHIEIDSKKLSASDETCIKTLGHVDINSQQLSDGTCVETENHTDIRSQKLSISDIQSLQIVSAVDKPVSDTVDEQIESSIPQSIPSEEQLNGSEIIVEPLEDVEQSNKSFVLQVDPNNIAEVPNKLVEENIKSSMLHDFTDTVEIKGNVFDDEVPELKLDDEECIKVNEANISSTAPIEEISDYEKSSHIVSIQPSETDHLKSGDINNDISTTLSLIKKDLPIIQVTMNNQITDNFRKILHEKDLKESLASVLGNPISDQENSNEESLKDTDIDEELSTDNVEVSEENKAALDEQLLSSQEIIEGHTRSPESGSDKSSVKEQLNCYEEKEQDSLSSQTTGSLLLSIPNEKPGIVDGDTSVISNDKTKSSEHKSPKSPNLDVKKRISEIMADTNVPRGDKSPRLQDLYVTTYDLVSPVNSPPGSPSDGQMPAPRLMFNNEAEEILRKQLAIEQEIKQITEQQQKESLPFMFVREIPNKPPPPYTPPSPLSSMTVTTIIPTLEEIEDITKYSSKILYKAYLSNNLHNINISDNTLNLICKNITKSCYKFVFDLCKEICKDHYKQFEVEKCAPWLQLNKKNRLASVKPLDAAGLEKYMCKKLKELFGYEKPVRRENAIIKWSRKKRDHVDEILVMESQAEESQWINYDKDELLVMDQVTNEIMNMLLKETGQILNNIFSKS